MLLVVERPDVDILSLCKGRTKAETLVSLHLRKYPDAVAITVYKSLAAMEKGEAPVLVWRQGQP